jgi:hypothetical protein
LHAGALDSPPLKRPIRRSQRRPPPHLAPQHRQFMAEHDDLQVLEGAATKPEKDQLQ